jgi:hypothetical protein
MASMGGRVIAVEATCATLQSRLRHPLILLMVKQYLNQQCYIKTMTVNHSQAMCAPMSLHNLGSTASN